MSDVVEKIARAIVRAHNPYLSTADIENEDGLCWWGLWIEEARAAIDALAESVSPEMIEAAGFTYSASSHSNHWTNNEVIRQAIRAAILAAKG